MQDFVESRREEDMGDQVYLPDFLQEVALLTDLDSDNGDENDKVTLMTIHSAKGLEFPTVFVVGLEENIFPSPMCTNSMRELEEERRLLYVAITRAEKHCILTCAQNRWRYGRMEYDTPSRFIRDIDPELLDVQSETSGAYGTGNTYGNHRRSPWLRSSRQIRNLVWWPQGRKRNLWIPLAKDSNDCISSRQANHLVVPRNQQYLVVTSNLLIVLSHHVQWLQTLPLAISMREHVSNISALVSELSSKLKVQVRTPRPLLNLRIRVRNNCC